MSDEDDPRPSKWADYHDASPWHFIFRIGILAWGIPMFVAMSLVPLFISPPETGDSLMREVAFGVLIWMIGGGTLFGTAMLFLAKRGKKKSETEEDPPL